MANIISPPPSTDPGIGGRFGRNGTDHSSAFSSNGVGQSTLGARWIGRMGQFWDRYAPFRNPWSAKYRLDPLDDDREAGNGVHAVTKKTDYWFNRELALIEQEATKLAAQWAEKGLPRHDVERVGVLEPEQVLGMKSLELFRQWHRRVRIKMQDQIQSASFRQFKVPDAVRVGYDRILKSSVGFCILAIILTVAEFTAIFPVLRLL